MPRQVRSQKPPTVSEALRLLRDCAKKLRVLKVLTKTQARNVRDRVNILNDIQTTPKRNKYKLFLYDLLCDAGPALVLLCVMSLGQGKVTSMNKDAREELRRQIKDRLPEFNDPILQSLASTHGVPDPPEAQNVTHKQMVPETDHNGQPSQQQDRHGSNLEETANAVANPLPQGNETIDEGQSGKNGRQIQYMFSKAPVGLIPLLSDLIPNAVQTSHLWRTERAAGEPRTDCLTTMIPRDENEDISITLWVGQQAGMELLNVLRLQPTWSSSLGHLSL